MSPSEEEGEGAEPQTVTEIKHIVDWTPEEPSEPEAGPDDDDSSSSSEARVTRATVRLLPKQMSHRMKKPLLPINLNRLLICTREFIAYLVG